MTTSGDICVIITAYRRPELLLRALRSVIAQACPHSALQVVVSDDDAECSSAAVVRQCQGEAPAGCQLVYLPRESGRPGVAHSRNRAVAQSRGEWIIFLDDDDEMLPGAAAALVSQAQRQGVDFCAGHYQIVAEDRSLHPLSVQSMRVGWSGPDRLLLINQFPIGSFAIRRRAIVQPFSGRLRSHEDWLFLIDNLVAADPRPGVAVLDQPVLAIYQSADRSRAQRNTAGGMDQTAADYARIYGLHPAPHLVQDRMRILAQLAPVSLESLFGGQRPATSTTVVPTPHGRFLISDPAEAWQARLLQRGEHEPAALALAMAVCAGDGAWALDVGAGHGAFALALSLGLGGGRVIATESRARSFHQLCANLLLNPEAQVQARRIRVGTPHAEQPATDAGIAGNELVDVLPLDDVAGARAVAWLRIGDARSAPQVLQSGPKLLSKHRPVVFVESGAAAGSDGLEGPAGDGLRRHGYQCVRLGEDLLAYQPEALPASARPALQALLGAVPARPGAPAGAVATPDLRAHARDAAATAASSQEAGLGLRLAVVVHLSEPALWSDLRDAMAELPAATTVFVTTPQERLAFVRRIVAADFPQAEVLAAPARGRDVGALVWLLREHDLGGFDFVLKLHGVPGASAAYGTSDAWRRELLAQLLPRGHLARLLTAMVGDAGLGIAGPRAWQVRVSKAADFEVQRPRMEALRARLSLPEGAFGLDFFAGSMAWIRGAVLTAVARLGLPVEDFEPDAQVLDAPLATTIERLLPAVAAGLGLRSAPLPLEDSQAGAHATETEPATTLPDWLDARRPSPEHARRIQERLAARANDASVALVVLDRRADLAAVQTTLDSLGPAGRLIPRLSPLVVSTMDAASLRALGVAACSVERAALVETVNAQLAGSDATWLLVLEAGDRLTESGLARVLLELADAPACRVAYADELTAAGDGELGAAFRPAFNLDLLLSFPAAVARHLIFRREVWQAQGGFDPAFAEAIELELVLRLIDDGGVAGIGHVAEPLLVATPAAPEPNDDEARAVLAHLHRRGYAQARVDSHRPRQYRIHYGHPDQPLVSILVPTRDQLALLRRCVESLLEQTRYPNYELLIVDNDSRDEDARSWLDGVAAMGDERVRVLDYPHPFNYAAINNMAARSARGDYLVLLNNDTAIVDPDWLDALLNHAQRPEVGIVGTKLLYPDGRIQHAGIVLGLRGPAEHVFLGEAIDAPGYMQRLWVDQNYSAVTAACLMIRRSLYQELGGLDEDRFKVSYNDVDLCLKAGAAGYLTVWTPHAVLVHEGSVSQNLSKDAVESRRLRVEGEREALYAQWMPRIANDPAYNANLSLSGRGFEFEADTGLTFRPLPWRPSPVVLAYPADRQGCGQYRIIQPLQALGAAGLADGVLRGRHLSPAELARLDPDVIVFQRQISEAGLVAIHSARTLQRALRVYELDDYILNLPLRSAFRQGIPKDVGKALRRGLAEVDRFVVSTPSLAQALAGFHPDTRVVKNTLAPALWRGLTSRPRGGPKPRVGWAGGAGHGGDLALIVDVVRELAAEVDWVFFGMCPQELLPHVAEVHAGVAIEAYPAKLASLDLDLGIAPLETNLFNECKSNLRLLEYGACAVPVIATDLVGYREDGLPVTLVKNKFKDWTDAIRDHVNDPVETARRGKALQSEVRRHWMLEGERLQAWLAAWTRG